MCDGCYAMWKWKPETCVIVKAKDLKENLSNAELKLPAEWENEISTEAFVDNNDTLKQMEALVTGLVENEDWMEPIQLDIY